MALTHNELLHLAPWDLAEEKTKRRLLAVKINYLLNDIADTLAIAEESGNDLSDTVAKRIILSRVKRIQTALT